MARPIDANALTDKLQRSQAKAFMNQSWEIAGCIEAFIRMIDEQPTIEAEPVRYAHWVNDTFCSECNRFPVDVSFNVSNQKLAKYFSWCPHCGAKIIGGTDNG
jgi:hypothetical protein